MSDETPTTDEVLRETLEALEMPLPNGYQFLRLGKSGADILLPLFAATRTAALEEAAGIAERRRPEIGPHILDTPYRRGLHDGGTRTAESIRAEKDSTQ